MTVVFSDEEKDWIETKKFNWRVKNGCPIEIKKRIEKKLDCINSSIMLKSIKKIGVNNE